MLKTRATIHKVTQDSYAKAFQYLMTHGQASVDELVEITGLHKVTMYDLLRTLRRHKVVHISGWAPDNLGRDAIALFSFGNSADVKRRRKSRAQIARDFRARKAAKERDALLGGITQIVEAELVPLEVQIAAQRLIYGDVEDATTDSVCHAAA